MALGVLQRPFTGEVDQIVPEKTLLEAVVRKRAAEARPPNRLVSLVPSLTEFVFAVGAGDHLVGITDYCVEPAGAVDRVARVGGPKDPNRAAILALRPDLIIAAKEENRAVDVAAFEAAGIAVHVTDICSVADVVVQLPTLARRVGASDTGATLVQDIAGLLATAPTRERPTMVLAVIWRDPWMAVGGHTYADDLLVRSGGDNVARQMGPARYPRAPLEAFLDLRPDVILLPDEPYPFTGSDLEVFTRFGDVPAVRHRRLHLCDGKRLTWYGPRTPDALRFFRGLLA